MRGVIYSLGSPLTLAMLVKERQDWVSCICSYPQLQELPAVLHPEMPRDVHPPSGIILKPQDQRIPKQRIRRSLGKGPAWGAPSIPESCSGVEGGTQGSAGCDSTGLARSVTQGGSGTARGREGTCLQEQLPAPTGALEILLFSTAVFVTVCVALLGWSLMRQAIPKLFFITFAIGGE